MDIIGRKKNNDKLTAMFKYANVKPEKMHLDISIQNLSNMNILTIPPFLSTYNLDVSALVAETRENELYL